MDFHSLYGLRIEPINNPDNTKKKENVKDKMLFEHPFIADYGDINIS